MALHRYLDGTTRVAITGSNGDTYHVAVLLRDDGSVVFRCDHPVVLGFGIELGSRAAGHAPCKHTTAVAEQLAALGYLERAADGGWMATPAARAVASMRTVLTERKYT